LVPQDPNDEPASVLLERIRGHQEQWDEASIQVITNLRVPILVVPNDLTLLAAGAPLSLVLLYRAPRGGMGLMAAASILVSLGAICVVRSRTAALTMVLGLISTAVLVQRRRRLAPSLAGVLVLLGVALLLNALLFPQSQVATRFAHNWTLSGRITYWSVAWAMFREAPLVVQGPHTFGLFHKTPWPHNLYLEVLAEQGVLDLAALGGMLACGIAVGWHVRRAPTEDFRLLGIGALASLMGLCAAAGVELTLLREWVATMLLTLLGVMAHLSASPPRGKVGEAGNVSAWDSRGEDQCGMACDAMGVL
jgi:O-antigen ligase